MMQLPIILLFITLIAGPVSAGDVREKYIRDNRLLEEELALARKPDIYFVFNLKGKMAHIKAKGIQLKELPVNNFNCWGSPVSGNVYRLKKKSTFFKPGREMIKPGASKDKDNFKIEALELADMPSRYTLVFDGGCRNIDKTVDGRDCFRNRQHFLCREEIFNSPDRNALECVERETLHGH